MTWTTSTSTTVIIGSKDSADQPSGAVSKATNPLVPCLPLLLIAWLPQGVRKRHPNLLTNRVLYRMKKRLLYPRPRSHSQTPLLTSPMSKERRRNRRFWTQLEWRARQYQTWSLRAERSQISIHSSSDVSPSSHLPCDVLVREVGV